MFGFVIADGKQLSKDELTRYKAVYCGLCAALKKEYGFWGRLTLTYDLTFLVLLLGSLYEPRECNACSRCMVHPFKKHESLESEITGYAADMNVALAYLNQLDNWRDDRNIFSLFHSKMLGKKYAQIAEKYPRQCGAMETCINELSAYEASGSDDPDKGARLFGKIMSELFVYREDHWSPTLREMGGALGEFIYIMDAVVDLDKDMRKGKFNPLAARKRAGFSEEYFQQILTMFIGDCTLEFDKLPLVEDVGIMRNILYYGVWSQYDLTLRKKARLEGVKRQ